MRLEIKGLAAKRIAAFATKFEEKYGTAFTANVMTCRQQPYARIGKNYYLVGGFETPKKNEIYFKRGHSLTERA